MIFGYARVSTTDQNLDIQKGQLNAAGADKIFSEQKSGTRADNREELKKCIAYLREGDTLIVTRLDRLARSMADFVKILDELNSRNVLFRCTEQPVSNIGPEAQLTMNILAACAQFETQIRKERQREGIEAAKAKGVYAKKRKTTEKRQAARRKEIEELRAVGLTMVQIGKRLGVSMQRVHQLCPHGWGSQPEGFQKALSLKQAQEAGEISSR